MMMNPTRKTTHAAVAALIASGAVALASVAVVNAEPAPVNVVTASAQGNAVILLQEKKKTGRLEVTVTGSDGKPLEGAFVRVLKEGSSKAKNDIRDKAPPMSATQGDLPSTYAQVGGNRKTAMPIAVEKTDESGKAVFEAVEVGNFTLDVIALGETGQQKVKIEEGKTTKEEVKTQRSAKKKRR